MFVKLNCCLDERRAMSRYGLTFSRAGPNVFVSGPWPNPVCFTPKLTREDLTFGLYGDLWIDAYFLRCSKNIILIKDNSSNVLERISLDKDIESVVIDYPDEVCIGLFGTCDKSKWRDPFMERYLREGIRFFNPQVDEWNDECKVIEAVHLANDKIILFPVTSESYAVGSLAETGFSILNALELNKRRYVIIMIEQHLDDELMQDGERAKDSMRARKLVAAHLEKKKCSNVFIVDSLEEMLKISLRIYNAELAIDPLGKFNPHSISA